MEFTTRLEPSFEMMVLLPRKDDDDIYVFQDIGNFFVFVEDLNLIQLAFQDLMDPIIRVYYKSSIVGTSKETGCPKIAPSNKIKFQVNCYSCN